MVASPLRVGLIGYGIAGAVFHAPLIAANPQLRLEVVVTASRREQVRSDYLDTEVVPDVDALLARGRLDLVVVASPNRAHFEHTTAALDAGLPVVVDKPFVPNAKQAQALIEYAERRGLMLTVFHNRRWDNDFRTVRRLIDSGELGTVNRFESRFERWVPGTKPGWRERGNLEEAGGVLYDLGSHIIDQALQLFGPVTRVYAEIDVRRTGAEVDDDVFVGLTHSGGVRSHLWTSKLAAQHGPRFRVLGDRAAFTKYGLDPQEADLRAGQLPVDDNWGREIEQRWGVLGAGDDGRRIPTEPGCYPRFYEAVADSLRNGTPPPVNPADAVAGLEIIEAARCSSLEGKVRHLG